MVLVQPVGCETQLKLYSLHLTFQAVSYTQECLAQLGSCYSGYLLMLPDVFSLRAGAACSKLRVACRLYFADNIFLLPISTISVNSGPCVVMALLHRGGSII